MVTQMIEITHTEKDIEDFLSTDKNLEKYLGLRFIARQVVLEGCGVVDILAYNPNLKTFVIIEIKKDCLDANALAQGMSYQNFYNECYSRHDRPKRKFQLLLIGKNLSSNLTKCVKHFFQDCANDDLNIDISYTLFEINLEQGIDFNWYNKGQQNYLDNISSNGCQERIELLQINSFYYLRLNQEGKEMVKEKGKKTPTGYLTEPSDTQPPL